jgi:hypothetical protein
MPQSEIVLTFNILAISHDYYNIIYDGFPTISKLPVCEVKMLNATNGNNA